MILYNIHEKALLIYKNKTTFPNGSIAEIIIWQLPQTAIERPHGFKYRLNYGLPNGMCLVRYDNKKGKGDHKHLRDIQIPYCFTTTDQLLEDFHMDVLKEASRS